MKRYNQSRRIDKNINSEKEKGQMQEIQAQNVKTVLEGMVESITFQSVDSSFAVFRLSLLNERGTVAVVGNFPAPLLGEEVTVTGEWVDHVRFGRQFKAGACARRAPRGIQALERFLGSGFLKGVGAVMASRMVKHFADKVLEIIEFHPHRLAEVSGIGDKTAQMIHSSYMEQAELREITFFLETHGITGGYAARIYAAYGASTVEKIKTDPFQMTEEVKGIGFSIADQIAAALGFEKDNPSRIAAGIKFALLKITQSGHCCIPEEMLVERTAGLLSQDSSGVSEVLSENIKQNKLCTEDYHGMNLVYPKHLYAAEKKVAERMICLKTRAVSVKKENIEQLVGEWETKEAISLSKEQKEALTAAFAHGVMVLTGGPGTGKTTIVKGILSLLEYQGLKIVLGAPTGRAAKRLSETTGREAMTVHRLLEAGGGSEDEPLFLKDENDPLDADAVIIDETSMMDIMLMNFLLKAVPDGCRLILVGDVDQLPAVGPGSVLKDIIRSGVVPVIKLTEVFRQTGESLIVLNAHRINRGLLPEYRKCPDFQFRQIEDGQKTAEAIVKLCAEELKEEGFDLFRHVQVLSPMHRQICGVENLNKMLQAALNPPDEALKSSVIAGGQTLREGDKVMQIKNNYLKGVFNGDIGYILAIEEGKILVRYPEDDVIYERGEHEEIALAYAISVHKSQGSEYQLIVMPLTLNHHVMLQRNLLYTAVTRAKERVILLGAGAALRAAVQNDRTAGRYSLLTERLKGESLESL